MRTAEREPASKKLAFIAVEGLQCDLHDHHFPQPGVLDREVVGLSGFSGEVRSGRLMVGTESDEGLPIGAEMVFAGLDGQVEVGIAMVRSHPGSVQPDARDRQGPGLELCVVFHEIEGAEGLAQKDWRNPCQNPAMQLLGNPQSG
jgi:hypothetical protein